MVSETDPRPLSREELSKFLPSKRAIRAFERIFELIPSDLLTIQGEIEVAKIISDLALSRVESLDQSVSELNSLKVIPVYEDVKSETLNVNQESLDTYSDITPPWMEVIHHVDLGLSNSEEIETFDLSPNLELGSMSSQEKDYVDITGGTIVAELSDSTTDLLKSDATLSDNSGAGAGTLANAPTAGDPTKWIAIDDNGTTRYIPTWT